MAVRDPGLTPITDAASLARAAAALAAQCADMARLIETLAPLPLRLRPAGFTTLAEIVVGQQVSTASAAAIIARLRAAGLLEQGRVAAAGPAALVACGLSRPKARYLSAIALTPMDWAALRHAGPSQARELLLALPGVGPWTAEVFALTALGQADAFPAGDLALQEAARRALDLPARPDAAGLAALAERWRPYRAVAARALWAYYRQEGKGAGLT